MTPASATSSLILTSSPPLVEWDDDCRADRPTILAGSQTPEFSNDCIQGQRWFLNETCADSSPSGLVFSRTTNAYTATLRHGFRLALSLYAQNGPCVLSPAAWQRWESFGFPKPLFHPIDFVLANQYLIHPHGWSATPVAGQPETLTAWLHITNACNLDCPYCYVRKSSARMSEETGLRAVESVFRTAQQNGFRQVKLKYAGGEATLHFRLVRRLHEHALQLAAKSGLQLKAVVLSNGVRLPVRDAGWLAENGVGIVISLDGIGELHDRLRPQKGGGNTFRHVAQTIDEMLLPCGIQPGITMTLTGINACGAADVAKWALVDRGLPTSFSFYRQNTLSASRTELALEEQAIIDGMLAAYSVIEKHLPLQPFLHGLLDRFQTGAHAHTCGVGQNYLVMTHSGQLAQCQMHLGSPVAPTLDGDLLATVARGPIRNLHVDNKAGCRQCEFRYYCSGGCPLETYRATGRWDVQSPNCRIYKTLFPAALRLEGLRLMKAHGYLS